MVCETKGENKIGMIDYIFSVDKNGVCSFRFRIGPTVDRANVTSHRLCLSLF